MNQFFNSVLELQEAFGAANCGLPEITITFENDIAHAKFTTWLKSQLDIMSGAIDTDALLHGRDYALVYGQKFRFLSKEPH